MLPKLTVISKLFGRGEERDKMTFCSSLVSVRLKNGHNRKRLFGWLSSEWNTMNPRKMPIDFCFALCFPFCYIFPLTFDLF